MYRLFKKLKSALTEKEFEEYGLSELYQEALSHRDEHIKGECNLILAGHCEEGTFYDYDVDYQTWNELCAKIIDNRIESSPEGVYRLISSGRIGHGDYPLLLTRKRIIRLIKNLSDNGAGKHKDRWASELRERFHLLLLEDDSNPGKLTSEFKAKIRDIVARYYHPGMEVDKGLAKEGIETKDFRRQTWLFIVDEALGQGNLDLALNLCRILDCYDKKKIKRIADLSLERAFAAGKIDNFSGDEIIHPEWDFKRYLNYYKCIGEIPPKKTIMDIVQILYKGNLESSLRFYYEYNIDVSKSDLKSIVSTQMKLVDEILLLQKSKLRDKYRHVLSLLENILIAYTLLNDKAGILKVVDALKKYNHLLEGKN